MAPSRRLRAVTQQRSPLASLDPALNRAWLLLVGAGHRPDARLVADTSVELDGYAARFGEPLFSSLWVKAWGDQYPTEVQPFSSCTWDLLWQLADRVACPVGGLLVDLGCGAGGIGLWLARRSGCRVIGVDRSGPAIEIAMRRAVESGMDSRAEFRVGQFTGTGLEAKVADAIVSVDALPFAVDVDDALNEIRRILRPGGRLVFTTRELSAGTEKAELLGRTWNRALERNDFCDIRAHERRGVSALWRALYDEWIAHESALREELPDEVVDRLLTEARDVGPRLDEDRRWFLVTAVAGT